MDEGQGISNSPGLVRSISFSTPGTFLDVRRVLLEVQARLVLVLACALADAQIIERMKGIRSKLNSRADFAE